MPVAAVAVRPDVSTKCQTGQQCQGALARMQPLAGLAATPVIAHCAAAANGDALLAEICQLAVAVALELLQLWLHAAFYVSCQPDSCLWVCIAVLQKAV